MAFQNFNASYSKKVYRAINRGRKKRKNIKIKNGSVNMWWEQETWETTKNLLNEKAAVPWSSHLFTGCACQLRRFLYESYMNEGTEQFLNYINK